jgi:hypothetical protein
MRKGSKKIQALLIRQGCVWVAGKGWEIDGNVDLWDQNLKTLPTFSRVGGDFYCADNRFTTLAGAPQEVGGDFWCHRNKLISLEGAPTEVGGDFYCADNRLTTLAGAPTKVGGDFGCDLAIKAHPAFEIYQHFAQNGMPELAAKTAAEIKI